MKKQTYILYDLFTTLDIQEAQLTKKEADERNKKGGRYIWYKKQTKENN